MNEFIYKKMTVIPDIRKKDVADLRDFIINNMNINISMVDTYLFWKDVSESYCTPWIRIKSKHKDMTREEFLMKEMKRHGFIVVHED